MRRLPRLARRQGPAARRRLVSPKAPEGEAAAVREFPSTRWSLVLRARKADADGALAELCHAYWGPICWFMRYLGLDRDQAQDLTQEFLAFIIARNDLGRFDPQRGHFRAWIRTCARNFFLNWRAHQDTLTAGGRIRHVSIQDAAACLEIPDRAESADRQFDRHFAIELTARAQQRLRAIYQRDGREQLLDHLLQHVLGEDAPDQDADSAGSERVIDGPTPEAIRRKRWYHRSQMVAELRRCVFIEAADTMDADRERVLAELKELVDALA